MNTNKYLLYFYIVFSGLITIGKYLIAFGTFQEFYIFTANYRTAAVGRVRVAIKI